MTTKSRPWPASSALDAVDDVDRARSGIGRPPWAPAASTSTLSGASRPSRYGGDRDELCRGRSAGRGSGRRRATPATGRTNWPRAMRGDLGRRSTANLRQRVEPGVDRRAAAAARRSGPPAAAARMSSSAIACVERERAARRPGERAEVGARCRRPRRGRGRAPGRTSPPSSRRRAMATGRSGSRVVPRRSGRAGRS